LNYIYGENLFLDLNLTRKNGPPKENIREKSENYDEKSVPS